MPLIPVFVKNSVAEIIMAIVLLLPYSDWSDEAHYRLVNPSYSIGKYKDLQRDFCQMQSFSVAFDMVY